MSLTLEKLNDAIMRMQPRPESFVLWRPPSFDAMPPLDPIPFGSREIVYSVHALRETTERNFPASKHRSKRVLKKLVKRYGSEFKMVPCIFHVKGKIIAHPTFKAAIAEAAYRWPPRAPDQAVS